MQELERLNINAILMSPPCQPFTRVGLKKDVADERTNAFISVLQLIERYCISVVIHAYRIYGESFYLLLSAEGILINKYLMPVIRFTLVQFLVVR